MAASGDQQSARPAARPPASPELRVQLLATEHANLLATRGMTWSEVMSRISIHLTVASAALVVLALVTQASGFGTAFHVLSIGLTSAVLVLGILTWVRVLNASVDDAVLLIGMNRLRAAYVEIDPTLSRYLVTSWHDDPAGVMQSYTMGADRETVSHVVGSTSIFMNIVNTMVAGTLGALVCDAAGAGPAVVAVVGTLAGLACLGVTALVAQRVFSRPPLTPRFPSPAAP